MYVSVFFILIIVKYTSLDTNRQVDVSFSQSFSLMFILQLVVAEKYFFLYIKYLMMSLWNIKFVSTKSM